MTWMFYEFHHLKTTERARLHLHIHEEQGCAVTVIFAGALTVPTAKDHFRGAYYEALDLIVSVIDKRFNQESFNSYPQMETLLVKAANGDDYESEFKFLEASYCQDVDTGTLPGQLSVLEALLKISCFDDILLAVTKVPQPEKKIV